MARKPGQGRCRAHLQPWAPFPSMTYLIRTQASIMQPDPWAQFSEENLGYTGARFTWIFLLSIVMVQQSKLSSWFWSLQNAKLPRTESLLFTSPWGMMITVFIILTSYLLYSKTWPWDLPLNPHHSSMESKQPVLSWVAAWHPPSFCHIKHPVASPRSERHFSRAASCREVKCAPYLPGVTMSASESVKGTLGSLTAFAELAFCRGWSGEVTTTVLQMVSAMKKSNTSDSSGERWARGCSWCLAMARYRSHSLTFSNSLGSGVMSFSWKENRAAWCLWPMNLPSGLVLNYISWLKFIIRCE